MNKKQAYLFVCLAVLPTKSGLYAAADRFDPPISIPLQISPVIDKVHAAILKQTICLAHKELDLTDKGKLILEIYSQFHGETAAKLMCNPHLLNRSEEMLSQTFLDPLLQAYPDKLKTITDERYRFELWKGFHTKIYWLLSKQMPEVKIVHGYFSTLLRYQTMSKALDVHQSYELGNAAEQLPNLMPAMLAVVRMLEYHHQADPHSCKRMLEEYYHFCCRGGPHLYDIIEESQSNTVV